MALPWYSSEFPLNKPDSKPTLSELTKVRSRSMVSINSVWNIVVKSNNALRLPRRDRERIFDFETQTTDVCHNGLINKAFAPMRLTMMALGRWPFPLKTKRIPLKGNIDIDRGEDFHPQKQIKRYARKVKNYDASLKSPWWIYFGLTTLFISFVLVMSTLGFLDLFLKWKVLPSVDWGETLGEQTLFRHNLVVFLLIWGCLVHGAMSSFSFLYNRKKVVQILNYWNVAVDELLIDEVNSHRRFLIFANLGYLMFLVLIYFAYSTMRIPLVRGGAELFGTLTVRPLIQEDQWKRTQFRVFGIVTMIYAIYASRAFLFLFCFKCRLLKSLFRVWNSRLIRLLKKSDDPNDDDLHIMEKIESERLLSEMAILLRMVKLTDKLFGTILQAYYAIQLLNMCFELYMLAISGEDSFPTSEDRTLDILTAVLTLLQNVYFFFTVSLDGACVGEEAAKGMEAVRSYCISPHSSIYRKYLIYNLGTIYNQRIALTGGKFFTIDKPFIITVLGAVLTYFVIILQVGPSLQKQGIDALTK